MNANGIETKHTKMNTEELKDIIECILKFDSTATDMQKARYFDIIQKDLKRVVKLLAAPVVSECKICKPDGYCSMFNSGETKCFDILYSKCKFYKR